MILLSLCRKGNKSRMDNRKHPGRSGKNQSLKLSAWRRFDPIACREQIEAEITQRIRGKYWMFGFLLHDEERWRITNSAEDAVYKKFFIGLSPKEQETAKYCTRRIQWVMEALEKTTLLKNRISPVFVSKIHQRDAIDIYAQMAISRTIVGQQNVPIEFEAIEITSAVIIATAIQAYVTREHLHVENVVDLGGGDGAFVIPFAAIGFTAISIERNQLLCKQAQENIRTLQLWGVPIPKRSIKIICGEFHTHPKENSAQIKRILRSADLMLCYSWTHEIPERLALFSNNAKPGALLALHHAPNLSWRRPPDLEALGLEPIFIERAETSGRIHSKSKTGRTENSNPLSRATTEGPIWCLLRKKDITKSI